MPGRLSILARLAGVLAAAALLPAVVAPVAHACGGPNYVSAKSDQGPGRPPYIIGDSTMIYAAPMLASLGFDADAKGCRQFSEGVAMVAGRKAAGTLPHVVVLALGANGPIADAQITQTLGILGPRRILVLVTPRQAAGSQAAMRRAAARSPERVLLVDWVAFSAGRGNLFAGDGLHVTPGGARVFSRFIRRSIAPYAFAPAATLRVPARAVALPSCGSVRRAGRTLRVFIARGGERMTCGRARDLARRPLLRPAAGWRSYDWRTVSGSSWSQLVARRDRKFIVGLSPA
ncbi:unannotated protein [freshwater metagenome]|uniref:Unannotated protein n=1 Tax=freshwater metagenome TaxID=449393 RepID=A0A6J7JHN5_9ZZZZ|nr:hypothetical protein [Actinomycetota bacterium]